MARLKCGPITLKDGFDNGKVAVEVWHDNELIATVLVEYFWDFIEDVLQHNPPGTVVGSRGQVENYLDCGRRFRQLLHSHTLPELNSA